MEPRRSTVTRSLGASDVRCTQLGLGGASLGDLYCAISHGQALATVAAAHAAGVGYYDTAPW